MAFQSHSGLSEYHKHHTVTLQHKTSCGPRQTHLSGDGDANIMTQYDHDRSHEQPKNSHFD